MRKAFPVLALIAFACDISRDLLVHGDPARKPEAAGRSGGYEYQTEPRGQLDDAQVPQSSVEDHDRSSEPPTGKWRSNGEALEPKWRDGDSVPLLPFSHYRPHTRDEAEDVEQHDFPETSRRPFKYHYSIDQPSRPRGSPGRRVPPLDDYDHGVTHRSRDYENPEDYPRKRRRPLKNPTQSPTFYEETIDSAASNDEKRGRNVVDSSLNDREVTWRYREAFQARPNEYEHEFSDEEYLRPRPRKRRPPQNYEFALANEASPNDGDEEPRDPSRLPPQPKSDGSFPVTTGSSDEEREKALELKSLLKMQQEEGSSLSEILQRRNLTLSDLLKGKAGVINALRSRIADESDEYIEEMSRVMSDSLMKLAATVTPPWRSTQPSATSESTATKITTVSSTTPDNAVSQMTIATHEVPKTLEDVSANDTVRVKGESEDAEVTQSAFDSSWLRAPTTPPIVSTVITTSTSPPPIAANSAEYFLNDDGGAGSTSDRATRLESLDEDEIMEFSDFTDFKKGKSPATPVWSSPPGEKVIPQQVPRDAESTLSIEQILNPTERIKPAEGRENNQDDDTDNNGGGTIRDNGQSVPIGELSAEDCNTFIEAEYQSDAPNPEDNGKQSKIKDNSSEIDVVADQAADQAADQVEKEQTASPIDDRKELRDVNHSAEYHQVNQSPGERARVLENHRGTRRYEEVVSEIEPEARAEIFELFASGSAGKRLERLLKSRNMSVEELIALRQRGSSKVHLTEVSQLRMSKPNHQTSGSTNTNNERIIVPISQAKSNEHFGEGTKIAEEEDAKQETEESMNQFKDIMTYLHDPFFGKDAENMSLSRLLDLVGRDGNAPRETTHPENGTLNTDERTGELENSRRTVQIVDLLTTFDSLPFAKDVQRESETEVDNEHEPKAHVPVDDDNASVVVIDGAEKTLRSDNSSEFHAGYVEEIVREEPNTIDIRTIYGETASSTNGGEDRKTLSKVKPSIIASGAILGVTIVVFLAIFIVCRIRQKQKYTYRNTFSRAVFQGPVMAARKLSNSSSLSAVMVNVVATSTTRRPERTETQEAVEEFDSKSDMDNDSLDANDSWETIPDYAK